MFEREGLVPFFPTAFIMLFLLLDELFQGSSGLQLVPLLCLPLLGALISLLSWHLCLSSLEGIP